MDNLTHTLTGVALARMGLDKRVSGATRTLALASNLPDLDFASALGGTASYLDHHRGITHAFPASPLLAAGLALMLSRGSRRFVPTFLLAWLAVLVHIVSDLWTSYGTRALLPFDATWYAWDWIFIVDPVLLVLLLLASFGARWFRRAHVNRLAMSLVVAYIGTRAGLHLAAEAQAQTLAGSEFTLVRVFPDPLSLNRWRFLGRNDTTFASGYVSAIGTSRSKVTFPRLPRDAMARRAAQESPMARIFLDFSAFPRLERRREGDLEVIVWQDLRFSDRRANGFLCEVKVNAGGRIVSERIAF